MKLLTDGKPNYDMGIDVGCGVELSEVSIYTYSGRHVSTIVKLPDGTIVWEEYDNRHKDVAPFMPSPIDVIWGTKG